MAGLGNMDLVNGEGWRVKGWWKGDVDGFNGLERCGIWEGVEIL